MRDLIREADPTAVEVVKWRRPSNPDGVPVWSHDGILCIGNTLNASVRLTFPKGARIRDPGGLFNARMDSRTVRAIDFHEEDEVNAPAVTAILREAVTLNTARSRGSD